MSPGKETTFSNGIPINCQSWNFGNKDLNFFKMVWQFTILESHLTKPLFFDYFTLYLVHKDVRTQISAAVHKDVALFGAQRCKISVPNPANSVRNC